MTYRNSSWTGRAPRTTEAAFGPYASGPVHPMRDSDNERKDRITVRACVLAFVALALLMAVGVV